LKISNITNKIIADKTNIHSERKLFVVFLLISKNMTNIASKIVFKQTRYNRNEKYRFIHLWFGSAA
jgi:hypothetical protein